jgi:hypothetical protein
VTDSMQAASWCTLSPPTPDVAAALHSRAPVAATLRAALPSQAFVNLVLLSAAPLAAGALAAIGCDAAQGRYYCGPLDPGAATTWLADHLRPTAARPRRGGAHPPRARKPGGRRQPAPVRHTAADGLGDP